MKFEIFIDGKWVEGVPNKTGEPYRLYDDAGGHVESYWSAPTMDNRPTFAIINESVKINGAIATAYNGRYTAQPLDTIELSGELHDSNGELVPLTIPITLKMPFVRYASGKPTDDEVYLNATLTNGVFTCTGVIPRSGAWYATTARNNQALNEINAEFQLSAPDAIFLA